jgi:phosphopantothenoylcysteine synthetase/decarboxylase
MICRQATGSSIKALMIKTAIVKRFIMTPPARRIGYPLEVTALAGQMLFTGNHNIKASFFKRL